MGGSHVAYFKVHITGSSRRSLDKLFEQISSNFVVQLHKNGKRGAMVIATLTDSEVPRAAAKVKQRRGHLGNPITLVVTGSI